MTGAPTGYPVGIMTTDPRRSPAEPDAIFVRTDTADAQTVSRFRHELSRWLRAHIALDAARLNDVLLAVNEALTNAAEFAYVGDQGAGGTMKMRARHFAADRTLSVDVFDHGHWREPDPDTPNTRGRGIPLMRALADRATIAPLSTGTEVRLRFDGCAPATGRPCATYA